MVSVRNRRRAIYREAIQVGIGAPPVLHRFHARSVEAAADGTVTACAGSAACAPLRSSAQVTILNAPAPGGPPLSCGSISLAQQPHRAGACSSSRATGSGSTGSLPPGAAGCAPGCVAACITLALPRIFYCEICAATCRRIPRVGKRKLETAQGVSWWP
jgi:hypothetical protein